MFPHGKTALGVPDYGYSFNVNSTAVFFSPSPASSTNLTGHLPPYPLYRTLDQIIDEAWAARAGCTCVGCTRAWLALGISRRLSTSAPAREWERYTRSAILVGSVVVGAVSLRGNHIVHVSYDDPRNFAAKVQLVRTNRRAGFVMWEAGGDCNGVLLDAKRQCSFQESGAGADGASVRTE